MVPNQQQHQQQEQKQNKNTCGIQTTYRPQSLVIFFRSQSKNIWTWNAYKSDVEYINVCNKIMLIMDMPLDLLYPVRREQGT